MALVSTIAQWIGAVLMTCGISAIINDYSALDYSKTLLLLSLWLLLLINVGPFSLEQDWHF